MIHQPPFHYQLFGEKNQMNNSTDMKGVRRAHSWILSNQSSQPMAEILRGSQGLHATMFSGSPESVKRGNLNIKQQSHRSMLLWTYSLTLLHLSSESGLHTSMWMFRPHCLHPNVLGSILNSHCQYFHDFEQIFFPYKKSSIYISSILDIWGFPMFSYEKSLVK